MSLFYTIWKICQNFPNHKYNYKNNNFFNGLHTHFLDYPILSFIQLSGLNSYLLSFTGQLTAKHIKIRIPPNLLWFMKWLNKILFIFSIFLININIMHIFLGIVFFRRHGHFIKYLCRCTVTLSYGAGSSYFECIK